MKAAVCVGIGTRSTSEINLSAPGGEWAEAFAVVRTRSKPTAQRCPHTLLSCSSHHRSCAGKGCTCRGFFYIVAEGAWILRCRCKHKVAWQLRTVSKQSLAVRSCPSLCMPAASHLGLTILKLLHGPCIRLGTAICST